MPRPWTDFPANYVQILLQFQAAGQLSLGPFDRRTAVAARSQLYRYRDSVAAAVKSFTDLDDMPPADLVSLHETFVELVTELTQVDHSDRYVLKLKRDPLATPSNEIRSAAE